MDKANKSGLSRLFAWFWRSAETDTAPTEVARLQSRLRHSSHHHDPMHRDRRDHNTHTNHTNGKSVPVERAPLTPEAVQVEHADAKHVPTEHAHTEPAHAEPGHGGPIHVEHEPTTHGEHGHGHGHGHGHHDVMVAKGTGGRLELHGNTLHLTKGGLFGFFVTLLGLHGGHAHQTIRVSDISAIEFEKHGFLFHYVRFCYPGAPKESGHHLHDMMADNALLMNLFDNRGLYRIKERIEQSMEAKTS